MTETPSGARRSRTSMRLGHEVRTSCIVVIYTLIVFTVAWTCVGTSRNLREQEGAIALSGSAMRLDADGYYMLGHAGEGTKGQPRNAPEVARREPMWPERGYNYYPFQDMFRPFEPALTRFKSLVMFTAGRSGMANVDALITAWGLKNFDYVLMLFDDSNSEWSRFDWYKHVVSITAQRQAKLWFYKRFASPWLVKGYRYVHFIDSDAGSPEDHPFDLAAYEALLDEHHVLIGQPATAHGGRSSDHPISRLHEGSLFRWTSFLENGPLFSVAQRAYECVWETINGDFVSGWGADFGWCQYASQVCGFPQTRTCAVIDAHYVVHLDKRTASAQYYHNLTYEDHGRREFDLYRERFASLGVTGFKSFNVYEKVPLFNLE